jgi:hypothetical protein
MDPHALAIIPWIARPTGVSCACAEDGDLSLRLILSHIFLTDAISMKCQEILQRKISQAAPEERGLLGGTEEKP